MMLPWRRYFVCEQVNDGDPITIFELITAAAFLKFSKTKSDFLILETGLVEWI